MFPPSVNNDLPNLLGTITAIILPTLGLLISLFTQRKTLSGFLRFLLRIFNRVVQDTSERPDALPANGNGAMTHQATLMAFSEGSKRVDSVEGDVDELRAQVHKGFKDVDNAIQEFGERMRIRADGDLLINSRKFEAVNKRIDNLEHDQRSAETRISELEDWRGAQ